MTPPVIEVVCGVQFEPLRNLLSIHFGDFWHRVKHDYPKTEDRPPIDDFQETDQGTKMRAELVAIEMPPHRRVFYIDSSDNFLLQLQPSRFHSNWRKERPEDEYPRFEVAFDRFLKGWNAFLDFAKDSGFGAPRTNQYELTYINHISEGEGEQFPRDIGHYIPLFAWASAQSSAFLPPPESAGTHIRFTLPESKGRLHVTIGHGIRKTDQQRIIVLELTARGSAKPDWADMDEWFALGHEWIVRGFTDLTSQAAHLKWGRER
jgi:uncharacterized protein (TIGR04255 family)